MATKSFELNFKFGGLSGLDRKATALDKLSQAMQRNANAFDAWNRKTASGGGRTLALGGTTRPGSAPRVSGPYTSIVRHQRALGMVPQFSDAHAQIMDHQIALARAQKALQRLNPGPMPFSKALTNFVSSTRIGGHGVMPLVGRSAQLMGSMFGTSGSEILRLAGPVALVVGGMKALYSASEAAARAILDFSNSLAIGGGTPGQTVAGMRLSSAIGVDAFADARRLQALSAAGGLQGSILRQIGVFQPGGFGRNPNAMNTLFRTLAGLRRQTGAQQDFNMQALGLEGYSSLIKDATDEQFNRAVRQGSGGIGGPQDRRAMLNFKLGLADIEIAFKKMLTVLTPVTDALGSLFRIVGQVIRVNILYMRTIEWAIKQLLKATGPAGRAAAGMLPSIPSPKGQAGLDRVDKALDKWEKWLDDQTGQSKATDKHVKALDANTRGLQANTSAMRDIFGGAENARGAVPGSWRYNMWPEVRANRQARVLGPFAVG